MAFGTLKGTLNRAANSILNPFAITNGGPVTVAIGDLVYAVIFQQTAITATACDDNLGNTYTPLNAGSLDSTPSGRAFYARVTTAGSLSSVSFTTTASANNVVALAAVIEGPFKTSPLDRNPANITHDIATPFTCPATTTLSQADEVVMCWFTANGSVTLTATSPNLAAVQLATQAILTAAIGHQTVTATTDISPAWTSSGTHTTSVLGTSTFMADLVQALTPALYTSSSGFFTQTVAPGPVDLVASLYSDTDAFFTQTVAAIYDLAETLFVNTDTFYTQTVSTPAAQAAIGGGFGAYGELAYGDGIVPVGAEDIAPALFANVHAFYTQTVTPGAADVSSILFADADAFFTQVVTAGAVDLAPALYSDAETFFTQTVAATYAVTATLYSDGDTFFTQVVSPGAVNLTPSLYSNLETYYEHNISLAGAAAQATIGGGFGAYGELAYGDGIVPTGAADISPTLFANVHTFYTQTISTSGSLSPTLYDDADTFYTQTVAAGAVALTPNLFADADAFFTQNLAATYALTAALNTDADSFFTQAITVGAANLTPSLYSDPETYYEQAISAGAGQLIASLYSDPDTFHAPTVGGIYALTATLHTDADIFHGPTITLGAYNILPELDIDPDTFQTHVIEGGIWNIIFDPLIDPDRFYVPSVYIITPAIIGPSGELATTAVERPPEMRWRKHRPAPRTKPSAMRARITPTGFLRR